MAQPTPQDVHVDGLGEPKGGKRRLRFGRRATDPEIPSDGHQRAEKAEHYLVPLEKAMEDPGVLAAIQHALKLQGESPDPDDPADKRVLAALKTALGAQEEDIAGHAVMKSEAERRERLGKEGKAFHNPDGHYSFPTETKDEIEKAFKALGRAPAALRDKIHAYIVRRANAEGVPVPGDAKKGEGQVELIATLYKGEIESQRLLYGVVLQPGVRDSQGDIVGPEEIEKAAHRYLVEFRKSDIQHSEKQAGVEIVESYIAQSDMQVGGEPVLKGSWVMVIKCHDPQVWEDVQKGRITGLSIGGSAVRIQEA